jgi:integrase
MKMPRAGLEPATIRSSALTFSKFSVSDFRDWCVRVEKLRPKTIRGYVFVIKKYIREVGVLDPVRAEEWLSRYTHNKTFNDYLIALRKLFKYYGLKLEVKQRDARPHGLVVAPTLEEVGRFISAVEHPAVRLYLALLATQGIRPERLLALEWSEVDLDRGWIVPRDGNVRSKFYRPQPIHRGLLEHLRRLRSESKGSRVFPFSESTLRRRMLEARGKTGLKIRREDLRKFFYNRARKTMRFEIVEWLMGHQLGVVQHYLADEIEEEYAKFAETVQPIVEAVGGE